MLNRYRELCALNCIGSTYSCTYCRQNMHAFQERRHALWLRKKSRLPWALQTGKEAGNLHAVACRPLINFMSYLFAMLLILATRPKKYVCFDADCCGERWRASQWKENLSFCVLHILIENSPAALNLRCLSLSYCWLPHDGFNTVGCFQLKGDRTVRVYQF